MQNSFVRGLIDCGYAPEDIHVWNLQVSFSFLRPHTRQPGSAPSFFLLLVPDVHHVTECKRQVFIQVQQFVHGETEVLRDMEVNL